MNRIFDYTQYPWDHEIYRFLNLPKEVCQTHFCWYFDCALHLFLVVTWDGDSLLWKGFGYSEIIIAHMGHLIYKHKILETTVDISSGFSCTCQVTWVNNLLMNLPMHNQSSETPLNSSKLHLSISPWSYDFNHMKHKLKYNCTSTTIVFNLLSYLLIRII